MIKPVLSTHMSSLWFTAGMQPASPWARSQIDDQNLSCPPTFHVGTRRHPGLDSDRMVGTKEKLTTQPCVTHLQQIHRVISLVVV